RTATRPAGPTRSWTTRSLRSRSGLCLSLTLTLALSLTLRRSNGTGSATGTTAAAPIETTHHRAHVGRKSAQHSVLLDDDRQRGLLLEFVDLDLAGCRINGSNDAANGAKTSRHDFL